MSFQNFLETGSFVNMDYIYGELSCRGSESPLDYDTLKKSDTDFRIVCTNALSGQPVYFTKEDMDGDHYEPVAASCSIPVVNKPYYFRNLPFFDGALSDPIPLDKALELGADKIVLILTKPKDHIRKGLKDTALSTLMKDYPKAAQGLASRAERYNEVVARARKLEEEGKVLIVAPDDTCGVDTLHRDEKALHNLYLKGYLDGQVIGNFLKEE